jgi:hypothetical protein
MGCAPLDMFRNVNVGNVSLSVRAISMRIVSQSGDLTHHKGEKAIHGPESGNAVQRKPKLSFHEADTGSEGRPVEE